MPSSPAVSDLVGPWSGATLTGLTQRCRDAWDIPLTNLTDLMVATFLNQNVAVAEMLVEAKRRLETRKRDESEYFDGQLLEAVERANRT